MQEPKRKKQPKKKTPKCLEPSPAILIAVASLVVHYEEWTSSQGHPYDKEVIDDIRNSSEVKEWFDQMNELSFLPVKRNKENNNATQTKE